MTTSTACHFTWLITSVKECIASDNIAADPVYRYAINLNSKTAELLIGFTYAIKFTRQVYLKTAYSTTLAEPCSIATLLSRLPNAFHWMT